MKMAVSSKEFMKMKCVQSRVSISSQIKIFIWVDGAKTDFTEMEFIFIQMEINSEENLKKESKKGEEFICINQELFTMESGKMIKKPVRELMFTQINKFTPVDGSMAKNMVTAYMST